MWMFDLLRSLISCKVACLMAALSHFLHWLLRYLSPCFRAACVRKYYWFILRDCACVGRRQAKMRHKAISLGVSRGLQGSGYWGSGTVCPVFDASALSFKNFCTMPRKVQISQSQIWEHENGPYLHGHLSFSAFLKCLLLIRRSC